MSIMIHYDFLCNNRIIVHIYPINKKKKDLFLIHYLHKIIIFETFSNK